MKEYCCPKLEEEVKASHSPFYLAGGLWCERRYPNPDKKIDYTIPCPYCPFCGDKLDKYLKSYVEIELDTLHYGDKRLHKFVNDVLKKNYTVTDQFESGSSYLVVIETEEDGDKVAYSLCRGFWEIKSAHDRRHDRLTLN